MHTPSLAAAFVPLDRRLALLRGEDLPAQADGAVLVADLRGFTAMGEKLARRLGPDRGAEELNRRISGCFTDLIGAVHRFGGAVVLFSGDTLVVSFAGGPDPLARATAAAGVAQGAMSRHPALSLKIGLGAGLVRRRLLGDPAQGVHELVGGPALQRAVAAMQQAPPGGTAGDLAPTPAEPCPWPTPAWGDLPEEVLRRWIPRAIYGRLSGGAAAFVAELRRVVPVFVQVDCAEDDLPAYVTQVQAILASFGAELNELEILDKGTVLVAFFGAPLARDDDAVRAVGAALALVDAGRQGGELASLRIGLSMGLLYAGLVGSPTRLAYSVYGDEMNVAARLMQAAAPWEVLVSARVRNAVESRYWFTSLPRIPVKGREEAVDVARVEGSRQVSGPAASGPLVGRRREMARLDEVAEAVWAGPGRIVLLHGEAGIGKSRLAAALVQRWREHGGQAYVGQAQAAAQQQPYLAWNELLRHLLALSGDARDIPRLAEIVAAANPALRSRLPLFRDVLGLPFEENELTRSFDAHLRQASTQSLIVDLLRAQRGPLLLLFEDAHWLDGPSWDLVLAAARGLVNRPVLLCLTARPMERLPSAMIDLTGLPHFEELTLGPFGPAEAIELAQARLGVSSLPQDLAGLIEARGQGNPFFIEEILHALEEGDFIGRGDRQVTVHRPLEQAELPDNVQGVVLARIDRLEEPDRLTLKVASVIGRVFAYPVLRSVHPVHAGEDVVLQEQLDDLQAVDIVLAETPDPELAYVFKHAVTHEVTYSTLLFSQRRDLHGRIARYYEQRYGEHLEPHYPVLAYHYGRTEDEDRFVYYCEQAGREAAQSYANAEAISFYTQALAALAGREGDLQGEALQENRLRRWHLLEAREALFGRTGQRDEERADVAALLALAEELGRPDLLREALLRHGNLLHLVNDYDRAREVLERLLRLARQDGDLLIQGKALNTLGSIAYYRGYCQEAVQHYEEALELCRAAGDEQEAAEILNSLGLAKHGLGIYDQALVYFAQAMDSYQRSGSYGGQTRSLGNMGLVYWDCGQYKRALEQFQQALALSRRIGNRRHEVYTLHNVGDLYRYMGRYEESIEYLQEAAHLSEELYMAALKGECLSNLGRVHLERGRFDLAQEYLGQALRIRESLGEAGGVVLDLSFLGRSALGQGRLQEALSCSRRALALLRAADVSVDWEQQVHYNHHLVCRAAGLEKEAGEAARQAYRTLLSLAERMSEEGRRSFLEDVRVNREIAAAWRELGRPSCGEPAQGDGPGSLEPHAGEEAQDETTD